MKKLIAIIVTLLLLPIVNAQQEDPGITPDSFLWGLDKALDQLVLLLTFDEGEKAKKGLEIARERLLEVKLMIEENKLEAAVKAKDEHGKTLIKVKQSIKEIEKDDSTEEIKEVIEIEKELEEHDEDIEQISGELKVKIKIKGEVTQQQQALIDSILNSLKGQTGEVEIEIENKKGKTKIKIKQETGKSEEEIEVEIEKLEIEAGISGIKVKAEIVGEQSEVEIEREFSTTTTNLDAIIDEIIEKFALDREIADDALEVEVEEEDEELKEKFKVKVEVEEGIAEVEVELKFILDTTDREEILDAIVEKSQLTREQIESAIEFEEEEELGEEEIEIEVEIKDSLKEIIEEILIEPFDLPEKINEKENKPYVILFCGINGTGKTTTMAKIADYLKKKEISCVLAAADTFRAASIEQLQKHGEKIGVKVISHEYGSDPAAVGFDAIKYAKKNFINCVLIDTAGRMHTSKNLLKEIEKISRVCRPDTKLFIGESITGNDSIEQAKSFDWEIGIDGIVLTKADVDERGGTALSLGYVTKKPILFLGTGQEYDDIEPFDKKKFIKELGL